MARWKSRNSEGRRDELWLIPKGNQANIDAARGVGMGAIRFQSVRQLRADLQEVAFPILPMPCEPAASTR